MKSLRTIGLPILMLLCLSIGAVAVLMRSKNSLANVITPRFKKVLETLDTSDSVIREMQKSDAYDWSPRTKMLLISLQGDKIVDPASTEKTMQTIRRRGVDVVRQLTIKDANLNHITAVAPVLAEVHRFFDETP